MPCLPRPGARGLWWSLVVLAVGYCSFGSYRNWPYKIESDGKYYYQFLLSAWSDGDLDFADEYRVPAPAEMRTTLDHYEFRHRVDPDTQRPSNVFTCGPALLWTPFFLGGKVAGAMHNAVSRNDWDLRPWSAYMQHVVMFAAVVYTGLGLMLLQRLAPEWALAPASAPLLVVLFASPLAYYTVFEASMSHAYDFFSLCLVLWCFLRVRQSHTWGAYLAAGAAAALHVLVRTQNLPTTLLLAAAAIPYWGIASSVQRVRYVGFLAALAAGVTPVFLINQYLFGHPAVVPQTESFGSRFLDWTQPHVWGVLFSTRNGLFSHHPFLLLGLAGYGWLLVRSFTAGGAERWVLAALGLAFLVQVYVNACVADWWGGHSFGQRRLVVMLPLFAFGLMELGQRSRRATRPWVRGAATTVVAVAVASGIYLTFIHVFLWDYDQPHDILEWMFVRAPQQWLS